MKAVLRTQHGMGRADLNFDRLVPLFPKSRNAFPWAPPEMTSAIHRRNARPQRAIQMAQRNRDHFPIEIANPISACRRFLSGLMGNIEGLERVSRASDYQLLLEYGICFEVNAIGRQVAELFQESFYPEEKLEFQIIDSNSFPNPMAANQESESDNFLF